MSIQQQIQEQEYGFPYHYLDLYPKCANWFPTERSYRAKVISLLGEPRGRRILDAGCGDGRLSYELARSGWSVTGLDLSERAIGYARAFSPAASFHVADLSGFVPSQQFDAITFIEVLEHIPADARSAAVACISRCLKDDGVLIVTVPSDRIPVTPKHYEHFSVETLQRTLSPHFLPTQILGHLRVGVKSKLYQVLLRAGRFLTPVSDRSYCKPYFALLHQLLRSVEHCEANEGERIIAVCRKASAR